ncbi:ABC transporter permease [Calycomorphotria hydatis]|uniref:ABC-2 family transporter protein n=1 Tax=Calycomorphotria hydatis TaxID=2528027 RepID=A0A517T851_9PLAN|nr:ABC transporter permease [Calycomorphotria hydatis]QDT64559.1 ABC-2 family transporter protein [Calycomorphotria hydatis]
MVSEITEYSLANALLHWAIVIVAISIVATLVTMLVGLVTYGTRGVTATFAGIRDTAMDLISTSPSRVWALGVLTFKEAVRRKALLVFVVFGVLFMFAGWFLSSSDQRDDLQVRVYVSFVLTTIGYLILPVVILLSCWGLPEDIRRRSLHTVVTKPVRRSEVVLGRILGFTAVSTLVLLVMSVVGYIWILGQVPESAKDQLVSRVPIYGMVNFYDPKGEPQNEGVNVGDIWTYRSYVHGGSKAHALFTFEGLTPDDLITVKRISADGTEKEEKVLRLESTFEAFRTLKGNIDQGLLIQYTYRNPADPSIRVVDPNPFPIQEFQTNIHNVPQELTSYDPDTGEAKTYNLFEDLVADKATVTLPDRENFPDEKTYDVSNALQIEVTCLELGQYLGVAQPDFFIRTPDRPFAYSYFKFVFVQWMMITLLITLGVTASCFVKGPVASMLVGTFFVIGLWAKEFLDELFNNLASGQSMGGGPIESIVRILQHMNPMTKFEPSIGVTVMKTVDGGFFASLWLARSIIPDFSVYDLVQYPAYGFDIDWANALLPAIMTTIGFLIPCLIIGHITLRFRELESK